MPVAPELKEILACPQCKGELEFREAREAGGSPAGRAEPEGRSSGDEIVCRKCKLVYRVEDDIPVMLVDEAKPLEA
jgi:uncharacterized protein YbaR (Trm112 family)